MERTVDVADDLCLPRTRYRATSMQRGTSSLAVTRELRHPGRSSGSTSTALRA